MTAPKTDTGWLRNSVTVTEICGSWMNSLNRVVNSASSCSTVRPPALTRPISGSVMLPFVPMRTGLSGLSGNLGGLYSTNHNLVIRPEDIARFRLRGDDRWLSGPRRRQLQESAVTNTAT